MTLKEKLQNWEDYDIAMYYLACVLGLANYDENFNGFRDTKWVYWCNNTVGNMLGETLQEMNKVGILEINDDNQVRWKPDSELK